MLEISNGIIGLQTFYTLLLIEILEWPTFGGKEKVCCDTVCYVVQPGSILTHFMFTVSLGFMRRPT